MFPAALIQVAVTIKEETPNDLFRVKAGSFKCSRVCKQNPWIAEIFLDQGVE